MSKKKILGLIAGQGRLPFLIADGAKRAGLKVVCVGLGDNADAELPEHVDVFFTGAIARPGSWMRKLRKHGVSTTVMVGRVAKQRVHIPWRILHYLPDRYYSTFLPLRRRSSGAGSRRYLAYHIYFVL